MTPQTADMPAEIPCHICGYDLRAHPPDGQCPECGASVAESIRLAPILRRPAWRDSDPRWRRRMLAGVWILVLLPLMDALTASGWAWRIPVPAVSHFRCTLVTLDDALITFPGVYPPLVFCIGVVLLFSKEKGRRRNRLDWTRRWGVLCSYIVLLLSAVQVLFIAALVLAGIAALFLDMPLKYQPGVTRLFVEVSTNYLRHGPYPKEIQVVVLAAFSSITILLACIPLFDALRSSGRKQIAASLLAPLALFALIHLAEAVQYCAGSLSLSSRDVFRYGIFFWPQLLVRRIAGVATDWSIGFGPVGLSAFVIEAAKWCIVLAIAVWLTIAQFAAWWKRKGRLF